MAQTQLVILLTSVALIIVGFYAAIFVDNIIKKIIGISFIEEGVNLFIVAIGYKAGGVVPILMPGMDTTWFASNAAYPLPFGLVLTSIVIGASTLAIMLALVMVLYILFRPNHTDGRTPHRSRKIVWMTEHNKYPFQSLPYLLIYL